MTQTLQTLADKQALSELVLRYARAVDRKDFDQLHSLYHPQAHHDHGAMFSGKRDALIDWLRTSMVNMNTQHLIANSLFVVEGNKARGEIYTVNFHHLPAQGINYIAGGRYLDHYERLDGRWVFTRRMRVIDWSEERPANKGTTAAGVHQGDTYQKDPAREMLSPFFTD